jgi:hypothetical protein
MQKLLLLLLIFAIALPFMAQEQEAEEPAPYTRADNECYAGGTMEGQCNQDMDGDGLVSQAEIDWAWNCGWYIARFNDGLYSRTDVPAWCSILLPVETNNESTAQESSGVCFISGLGHELCLDGNYLSFDADNDGTIQWVAYLTSDSCPFGTMFSNTINDFGDSQLKDWLGLHGFSLNEKVCLVL